MILLYIWVGRGWVRGGAETKPTKTSGRHHSPSHHTPREFHDAVRGPPPPHSDNIGFGLIWPYFVNDLREIVCLSHRHIFLSPGHNMCLSRRHIFDPYIFCIARAHFSGQIFYGGLCACHTGTFLVLTPCIYDHIVFRISLRLM